MLVSADAKLSARDLALSNWESIRAVATMLIEKRYVDAATVKAVVDAKAAANGS